MKIFMTLLPAILTLMTAGLLIGYDKVGGMDFFKEKCTFEEAIKALKSGYTIHRINGYSRYTIAETTFEGKTEKKLGTIYSDNKFKNGIVFCEEDILSNQWIIENKKENK